MECYDVVAKDYAGDDCHNELCFSFETLKEALQFVMELETHTMNNCGYVYEISRGI